VPAHTAPYKADGAGSPGGPGGPGGHGGRDPGPEHRLRMCQLVAAGVDGLSVCAIEIERGGLSYTVDTLESVHASHPDAQLTLIVGADTASTLGSWREPRRLLELADLAVAARIPRGGAHPRWGRRQAGAPRTRVLDALSGLLPTAGAAGVRFLEMPTIEVSSSLVRQRVADGESVDELVGPAVAGYIAEHGLYASAGPSR
jgi:nicotinate-nucleotide adenylyltransferase